MATLAVAIFLSSESTLSKYISGLAAIALLLLMTSCKPPPLEWYKPATHTITCADYALHPVNSATLYNNVWNKRAARGFPSVQCLEKDPATGDVGWSWRWPHKDDAIFAYPQIKIGASPWAPEPNARPEFPLKAAELKALMVSHELAISGNSEHNIATSMWLTNTGAIGKTPNPTAIIAELMIWSYASANHMNPAGKHFDDFSAGGQQWEVWGQQQWRDPSGVNNNKWTNLTFRAKQPSYTASFDALQFVRYGIDKKLLPADAYIADVEVGTEIMRGAGLAWVRQFEVKVVR